mmetsp:Transcript_21333/g.22773  ORF Transcript_21333/g.22773 Transcript_21333/m.22773 type:complete len:216 (-) Transcript_21333:93-740(-)
MNILNQVARALSIRGRNNDSNDRRSNYRTLLRTDIFRRHKITSNVDTEFEKRNFWRVSKNKRTVPTVTSFSSLKKHIKTGDNDDHVTATSNSTIELTPYSLPCRVITTTSITKDTTRVPDTITISNIPQFLMTVRKSTTYINDNGNYEYFNTTLDEETDSLICPTPTVQFVCIPTNFNHADELSINSNIQTDRLNQPTIHDLCEFDDTIQMMYNY